MDLPFCMIFRVAGGPGLFNFKQRKYNMKLTISLVLQQ